MTKTPTNKTPGTTQIALLTGIGCIACCALPLLGVAIGSLSIAGLSVYSEKAAMAVAVIGIIALITKRSFRKEAPSCDLNGHCAANKEDAEKQKT